MNRLSDLDVLGWFTLGAISGLCVGLLVVLYVLTSSRADGEAALAAERLYWQRQVDALLNRIQSPEMAVESSVHELEGPKPKPLRAVEPSLGEVQRNLEQELVGINDELARRGVDPAELGL